MEYINKMGDNDLASLYQDACDLDYGEMKAIIEIEHRRRAGEIVPKHEIEAAIKLVEESGGCIHFCGGKE